MAERQLPNLSGMTRIEKKRIVLHAMASLD
jgi:hypothetical protein